MKLSVAVAVASLALAIAARAASYTIDLNSPSLDRWNYPFAFTGGTRTSAPTFGSFTNPDFDNRDGQMIVGFNTASTVPAGLGASNYEILSATFTLSIAVGDVFHYDPTADLLASYNADGSPNNDDAGRPIELFGVAYRNGFTIATYQESTSYTVSGQSGKGVRTAFATDFLGGTSLDGANRDVSNNLGDAFDPVPFAIGQIAGLAPGDLVPQYADVTFTLNLANPDVVRYLQLSLDAGKLNFAATSLHRASEMGANGPEYPDYFTKENAIGGLPGRLDMSVITSVPEPGTALLMLGALGAWALRRKPRL